jgi:hypothetical protein
MKRGYDLWRILDKSIYEGETRERDADSLREWLDINKHLFAREDAATIERGISAACSHKDRLRDKLGMGTFDEIRAADQLLKNHVARVEK